MEQDSRSRAGGLPDGGQRWPNDAREPRTLAELQQRGYRTARTLGHELRADWSYLEGDLSEAYSPQHVERHHRAFVCLSKPSADVECALVVFDRVRGATPKRWLLHTAGMPSVSEGVTTSGNGRAKLTHQVLLPKEHRIDVVGGPGSEFTVSGKNYVPDSMPVPADEAGEWRVEVIGESPEELFLNLLSVTGTGAPLAAMLLTTATHTGLIVGDWVVLFSTSGEKIAGDVQFELPPGVERYRCIVTGLASGVSYFEAPPGPVNGGLKP